MKCSFRLFFIAGVLTGIPAFFSSCDRLPGHSPRVPEEARSLAPGRDEVALSGDYRLTLTSYEALKAVFPELSPKDRVMLGLISQWLLKQNPESSLRDAARCVRLLFPPALPAVPKREALEVMNSTFGFSNQEALRKKVDDAWGNRALEWNPDLRRELGLTP